MNIFLSTGVRFTVGVGKGRRIKWEYLFVTQILPGFNFLASLPTSAHFVEDVAT
jgi:hypothetical protein